ncbi:MAG: hypothetical protein HZC36_02915 [Armatimonadetes bacterium]|nr:hypothetical protein [Armatimonadota bacterium]
MDRWRLNRTATIVGKMLLLNKPIEEYCGDPYQGLYLRRNGRELYLVPAGALERAIAFGGGRRNQIEDWVSFESFARTPDR